MGVVVLSATSSAAELPVRTAPDLAVLSSDTPSDLQSADAPAGPLRVRFDFSDGCRVLLPECDHPWRVRLSAIDARGHLRTSDICGESS